MSIKKMSLTRLIKLMSCDNKDLITDIRKELNQERKKAEGLVSMPRDFYMPFWSDAKAHTFGISNLEDTTKSRVQSNDKRKTLYPIMMKGFLNWLNELTRTTNKRLGRLEASVHSHLPIDDLDLTVKVDNTLGIKMGDDKIRIIYPYFAKQPRLKQKWARVALWLMSEALEDYSITEMELLDVYSGQSFNGASTFLRGDEEHIFREHYKKIINKYKELKPEYID